MLKSISLLVISIILLSTDAKAQNPERDSLLLLLPMGVVSTGKFFVVAAHCRTVAIMLGVRSDGAGITCIGCGVG